MNVKEVFTATRKLLADEKHWIKGTMARTAVDGGRRTGPAAENATCWCLAGGIARVTTQPHGTGGSTLFLVCNTILRNMLNEDPIMWNDRAERKHSEVLDLLDKAIGTVSDAIEQWPQDIQGNA